MKLILTFKDVLQEEFRPYVEVVALALGLNDTKSIWGVFLSDL